MAMLNPSAIALAIALFPRLGSADGVQQYLFWPHLLGKLLRHEEGVAKEAIGLWSPAEYRDVEDGQSVYRLNANVRAVGALVLDIDDGPSPKDIRPMIDRYEWALHSSWGYIPGVRHKFRVVLPLLRAVPTHRWRAFWEVTNTKLALGHNDRQCKDESRAYYWPCGPIGVRWYSHRNPGVLLDPAEFDKDVARWEEQQQPTLTMVEGGAEPTGTGLSARALMEHYAKKAAVGNRNHMAISLGNRLAAFQVTLPDALGLVREFVQRVPQPADDPYTAAEAERAITWAYAQPVNIPPIRSGGTYGGGY